jgi:multisubunit Na+/H+ antiporter MnhB subunit
MNFGLPLAKLATPGTVLVGTLVLFYIGMYAIRKTYKRTRDVRPGFVVSGIYSLFIVLAGMYYAGQLGIMGARTFEDTYVEFSTSVGVVLCVGVGFLSVLKPKGNP